MEVFYLKYRPQTLDELIGQEGVKETLLAAFTNHKLAHAYLLVGPRGTGKTSTARILAKMVNCQKSEVGSRQSAGMPCNQCDACLSITDGSNLDLIEIDAASNRGIEDIRALRERIKLVPTAAKRKVYIIDEVHMLTTEAFNALLKTLEEPPAHALFILATTDVLKVPQTILSRVVRVDFKLATANQLNQALKKIIRAENIQIEEEALTLLINRSEGSFRDAVKLLDQLSSLNKKVTGKDVTVVLHGVTFEHLSQLLKNLANKDAQAVLLQISQLIEEGTDIKNLILTMMDIMRQLLLIKNDLGEELVRENFWSKQYDSLIELARIFSLKDLIFDLDILQKAYEKLKFASIPSLPLEIAVVEICQLSVLSESVSGTDKLKTDQPTSENRQQKTDNRKTIADTSSEVSTDMQKLKEKWTFVLETIRPSNFSLEALLRSVRISECTDSTVIMEVPYSFHQRILEAPKNRDLLEGVFSEILGRNIRISTILGNRPQRKEDIANIEVAADDEIIRIASEIFNSESN